MGDNGADGASGARAGLMRRRGHVGRREGRAGGRLGQRLHWAASEAGIAMHPLNQPVETIDRERQLEMEAKSEARLAEIVNNPDWQPTFCFRGGLPTREAPASARRSVETVAEKV